jgi:hypothetical protein
MSPRNATASFVLSMIVGKHCLSGQARRRVSAAPRQD